MTKNITISVDKKVDTFNVAVVLCVHISVCILTYCIPPIYNEVTRTVTRIYIHLMSYFMCTFVVYTCVSHKAYLAGRQMLITKTCLYNFNPLKPHFYIVKPGFTGVYIIFLISAQHIDCGSSLEPPHRGGSNEYPQCMFLAEMWKI